MTPTLREMREAKGLRLEEVAVATGYTFTHCATMERRGQPNPSHHTVYHLARLYGQTEQAIADALKAAARAADRAARPLPGIDHMPAFLAAGR